MAQRRGTDRRVGAKLRARRIELGLSQDDVAEGLGVSQVQVAKYERGENQVPLDKARALVKVLKIDIAHLLGIQTAEVSPWAMDIARKLDALPEAISRDFGRLISTYYDLQIEGNGLQAEGVAV